MTKKYVFKPYRDAFSNLFSVEKARIEDAIAECLDVQHVGSTAIPDLGGKGIIDIAIAVAEHDLEAVSQKMQGLGYLFRESGSAPERLFFRADLPDAEENIRRYHVHLTFLESREWKGLILLGYILLGALLTRLSIIFSSHAPIIDTYDHCNDRNK
ncbi:MAG: GrpB family protein [Desulfobacterium sp.]